MPLDRLEAYKTAVAMYQREHIRWVQNALVLFGALAAVFLIYKEVRCVVPVYVPMIVATVISLMTVCVAVSIRGSTNAWRDTLRQIENSPGETFSAFEAFSQILPQQKPWRDLLARIDTPQNECTCRRFLRRVCATVLSVTRVYAWVAIALTMSFGTLSIVAGCGENSRWVQQIEHGENCATVAPVK